MSNFDFIKKYTEERYLDKEEFLYRHTNKEDWGETVAYRKSKAAEIPLLDQSGNKFWFIYTEKIRGMLDVIDEYGNKSILDVVAAVTQSAVLIETLIDEAYYSSVIEGAFSTKKQANYIIKNKIEPKNLSEKMIKNNFNALNYIIDNIDHPLNEDMLLKVFRIITENTLDAENVTEKYRNDTVEVINQYGETIYAAPEASKVQTLMDGFFDFLSRPDKIHPVLKSCILHFYFVYIHPFFDGNGRTARAIAMMYIIQNRFEFFKFFTLSGMINEKKKQYYKAIKQTEDYNSDLTYFIDFMLELYVTSILSVTERILGQTAYQIITDYLKKNNIIISDLQKKLIKQLLNKRTNSNFITIDEYKKRFNLSYEKARTDLQQLHDLGLLNKSKSHKKFIYSIISYESLIALARGNN